MEDVHGGGVAPSPTNWRFRESESAGYTEKRHAVGVFEVWEITDLAPDAVVTEVTLIPYRGDKPVVSWQAGQMRLPEGPLHEGETVEAAAKRIAREQTGIDQLRLTHIGHFRHYTTSEATTEEANRTTYKALFAAEVESLADFPSDQHYERRQILQRDLNQLLRSSYVERRREFTDALDLYLVGKLKAQTEGS